MSEKFRDKYRSESARLQSWDYSSSAAYFITICTKHMEFFFGDVIQSKMILNEIGKIAELEWLKTFEMRLDMNLKMGEFVVMPNHFHAIIIIGENDFNTKPKPDMVNGRDAMHCVPTHIRTINHIKTNQFGPQSKNLASIVRGFKIGVTRNARLINPNFAWQTRFYDHIIRNDESFYQISEYIKQNPSKWNKKSIH